MNVKLPEDKVAALCAKKGVSVSAIEVLPSGGTHLVLNTAEGAATMRQALGANLIEGTVKRFPFYRPT